jgi:type II secretory pathway pseudopilin PulG
MLHCRSAGGFSLLEALLAATLLAGAVGSLAHLVTRSAEQSLRSERVTVALALAQAKLEQLRATTFAFDASGARLDSPELTPSAGDSLIEDSPPHVERLDRFGEVIAPDTEPAFVRRWLIAPAPLSEDTLVLASCVFPARAEAVGDAACVWGVRTRRP